ncbi:N-acetylneuraminate synthase family protein [Candidatus Uhrbacteria bacterium]|nr:N-acetylneuraminate synthase family protein [Candidatus Uhrbacteria bacterium]
MPKNIRLGKFEVGQGKPVMIIAEIGINYNGSFSRAKELVSAAVAAGADVVKFQKRDLETLYQKKLLENPNLGEQSFSYILPIYRECDLSFEQMKELKEYTEAKGAQFLCTPFDIPSVDFLEKLNVDFYKIASCDLTNFPLLERIAATSKPVIASTGLSTILETKNSVEFLQKLGVNFALLHCVGVYPAPIEDLNLLFIDKLRELFGVPVGYSGHERGMNPSLAAVARGACIVERHITLNRHDEGPDHLASLEPEEFSQMVKSIREIEKALGAPSKVRSHGEIMNRKVLGKSLVAAADIKKGTEITKEMITVKGPAKGLSPQKIYELVGVKALRDIPKDDLFTEADLRGENFKPEHYDYKSLWGLKTRFHEADFAALFNPKFFEFHLTDRDVEEGWEPKRKYDQMLVIHAPDYWQRRMNDLCSLDDEEWNRSIKFIQKSLDLTRQLAPYFSGAPKYVIHTGGMVMDQKPMDGKLLLERAHEAISRLSYDGITLLPENLPPFAWYFAGQWFHKVFMDAEEMVQFCRGLGLKMCFDTAHSKLYCNFAGKDYLDYVRTVAPITDHIHIADASGITVEAVNIGEGEIEFGKVFDILKNQTFSWTPEIWEGHLNNYEGFRAALQRLKPYLP